MQSAIPRAPRASSRGSTRRRCLSCATSSWPWPTRSTCDRASPSDAEAVLNSIRESEQRPSDETFTVTRLTVPGHPACVLAIQKEQRTSVAALLSLSQGKWRLTASQSRVLELLIMGHSNKEIARQLSCATVTVENHVTELYRRSGARSRADLVRMLFLL
jgi:DNA-binding NarL/FixJ family response regulator